MPFLRAHKPRHAKPSKAAPALAVGGLTASFGALSAVAAEASPGVPTAANQANRATEQDFARLRQCESGGNYAINTGNGYYGAYQFDRRTWQGLGYPGTANQAAPSIQDEAAARLQADRGWQPWPACSRKLGLGQADRTEVRASRSSTRVVLTGRATVVKPPLYSGRALTTNIVKQNRPDVRTWQARMAARGWDITVDGHYGPQSAHVAARFAAEKHVKVRPGMVNRALWNAAWQTAVS